MFSDSAETLKRQFTDKYVAVDAARPELARFRDVVGQVKTVNMNGRALVEFLDYHLNIGWFDIDVSALKIVDKPPPRVEKKAEAKKPAAAAPSAKAAPAAGEKKLSPLEMARAQGASGAAKPAAPAKPAGEKKSVADILAAARGGSAPAAKDEAKSATAAPKPAAPKGKSSTADILAAARGGKPAAPAAAAPAEAAPTPKPPAPEPPAPPAASAGVVKVDRASMSVADMIAYARKSDAK